MNVKMLLKAYAALKADDDKQKRYKDLLKQSFTLGMAEELARTSLATGQVIKVTLADNTQLEFLPPEDPMMKRHRLGVLANGR